MKIAADIMTPNPISFKDTLELGDVTAQFIDKHISSAPIIDVNGKVIGVLTESGIMKCFLLLYSRPDQKIYLRDVMNLIDPPAFVSKTDTIDKILKAMIGSKTSRVVVASDKKIEGVISPKDILKVLFDSLLSQRGLGDALKSAAMKIQSGGNAHVNDSIFYQFIEVSPYIMHSLDDMGFVKIANRKLHNELGYEYPELIGKSYKDLYLEKYWHEAERGLKQSIGKKELLISLTSMKKKDGNTLPVEVQTSGLFDSSGKFIGTVSVSRSLENDTAVKNIMGLIGVFEDKSSTDPSRSNT